MLLLGCAKAAQIAQAIDGQTISGVTFTVLEHSGMSLRIRASAPDAEAKAVLKQAVKAVPAVGMAYVNIQCIDENGTIL